MRVLTTTVLLACAIGAFSCTSSTTHTATPPPIKHPELARPFTLPRTVLLGKEFAKVAYGPGTVTRTDRGAQGVRLLFDHLQPGQYTSLQDNYPVSTAYGQTRGHGQGDFSSFDGLRVHVKNVGKGGVTVVLAINTGFTGPSGRPSGDESNDTYWRGEGVRIAAGESADVVLRFDGAHAANITDNKPPHTQGAGFVAINAYDRTEVTSIAIAVCPDDSATAALLIR